MTLDLMALVLAVTVPVCGAAWLIGGKLERLSAQMKDVERRLELLETKR